MTATINATDVNHICMVGLGKQGLDLIQQLVKTPEKWQLSSVVDRSVMGYARFQSHYAHLQTPFFNSLTEALRWRTCDVLVVATTAPSHVAICLEAIEAGYSGAILVEKPVSDSIEQARVLRAVLANNSECQGLAVGHYRRTSDIYALVKSAVDEGEYGSLRKIEFARPGKLSMKGSHYIDQAIWLAGSAPAEVKAQLEDTAAIDHRGAIYSDPPVNLEMGLCNDITFCMDTTRSPSYQSGMMLYFDKGWVHVDEKEYQVTLQLDGEERVYTSPDPDWHSRHYAWFENTLAAMIADDYENLCTVERAVTVLEVIAAAQLSDRQEGRWIALPMTAEQEIRHSLRIA